MRGKDEGRGKEGKVEEAGEWVGRQPSPPPPFPSLLDTKFIGLAWIKRVEI